MILTKDLLPSKCHIGDYTYGDPKILGLDQAQLSIGKFCSISSGVVILLGAEHQTHWVTTYPFSDPSVPEWGATQILGHPTTKGNVTIGNDVWIGMDVLILSGTTIGDGAIIGARSVVSRDVPMYSVVAGNPVRFIRDRFSAEATKALCELKWWDWPIERIKENLPLMMSANVDEFVKRNQ